jgi:outer membrane biosynthesis protein TonB
VGDDGWGTLAYVIILAIAGLFALVRKAIEKASSGEKGKDMDLADEVQKQIRRYMRDGEGGAPTTTAPTPPPVDTQERPTPPRPLPAERPRPAPAKPKPPPPRPRPEPQRTRKRPEPALLTGLRPKRVARPALVAVLPTHGGGRIRLTPGKVREAVVTAELLGPPLALRDDYRLF